MGARIASKVVVVDGRLATAGAHTSRWYVKRYLTERLVGVDGRFTRTGSQ